MNEKFLILERSVRAALDLKTLYPQQIESFLQFVQSLE